MSHQVSHVIKKYTHFPCLDKKSPDPLKQYVATAHARICLKQTGVKNDSSTKCQTKNTLDSKWYKNRKH